MKKHLFFLLFTLVSLTELFSQRLPDLIPYRKGNLWGYCDSTKKIIIEPKYKSVELFSEGFARVIFDDKTYGSIDTSGTIRIKYDVNDTFIADFHHGLAAIYRHRWRRYKTGFVDRNFKLVIPLIYNCDDEEFPMGFFFNYSRIKRHGKEGLIDTNGTFIIKPNRKIIQIYEWNDRLVEVCLNDSFFVFDVQKKKYVLNIDSIESTELKEELIKLGYDHNEMDRLFASFTDFGPSNLYMKGGDYTDKYGTKYWDWDD